LDKKKAALKYGNLSEYFHVIILKFERDIHDVKTMFLMNSTFTP